MTKTLLITLFAAFFLVGGISQSYACPGHAKCNCASQSEAKVPCEKEMGKDCKCGKKTKKPCEKKCAKKSGDCKCGSKMKPCERHDTNIRTGDEVRSNIGSLKMNSGIQKDSYND